VSQFSTHAGPRKLLLDTASTGPAGAPLDIVEASPHDFFWGRGVDGSGANHLGTLLMSIRAELSMRPPDQERSRNGVTAALDGAAKA
jgi:predicted NAD-dependent protein-ADP-ribosyltransferase YbiA (DUF1768 family)